jgi:protein-L-isoaspartate(D-aspartate) O-methyltransferase
MPLLPFIPSACLIVGLAAWLARPAGGHEPQGQPDAWTAARGRMVDEQIAARGVRDPRVLDAMRTVPRHLFVPPDQVDDAYLDSPLPIGHGQTISQPYIVALMTELARPQPTDRVLDVGTGCGYQAAVLARLVRHVYTVEIVAPLAADAGRRLAALGYANVTAREGDGYAGWPSEAPFDSIVVAAAPETVPRALVDQLRPGGRLVIPVGNLHDQVLQIIEKDADGRTHTRDVAPVRFVPLVKR